MAVIMKRESEFWRPWSSSDNNDSNYKNIDGTTSVNYNNINTSNSIVLKARSAQSLSPKLAPSSGKPNRKLLLKRKPHQHCNYNLKNIQIQNSPPLHTDHIQQEQLQYLRQKPSANDYNYLSNNNDNNNDDNDDDDDDESTSVQIHESFSSPAINNYGNFDKNFNEEKDNINSNVEKHIVQSLQQRLNSININIDKNNDNTVEKKDNISTKQHKAFNRTSYSKSIKNNAKKEEIKCTQCGVCKTSLWRRNGKKNLLCNACGLYEQRYKRPRTVSFYNINY
eukprot:Pgem_evm1s5190